MTRKLILDLDTGIDDTLAIAYALASGLQCSPTVEKHMIQ